MNERHIYPSCGPDRSWWYDLFCGLLACMWETDEEKQFAQKLADDTYRHNP